MLSEWELSLSEARVFPLQQMRRQLLPLWRSVVSDHRHFFIFFFLFQPTNAHKCCISQPRCVLPVSMMQKHERIKGKSPQDNSVNSLRNPKDVLCIHLFQLLTYNKYTVSQSLFWKDPAVI